MCQQQHWIVAVVTQPEDKNHQNNSILTDMWADFRHQKQQKAEL